MVSLDCGHLTLNMFISKLVSYSMDFLFYIDRIKMQYLLQLLYFLDVKPCMFRCVNILQSVTPFWLYFGYNPMWFIAEHEGPVTAVDFSSDGLKILAGTSSVSLKVWNANFYAPGLSARGI